MFRVEGDVFISRLRFTGPGAIEIGGSILPWPEDSNFTCINFDGYPSDRTFFVGGFLDPCSMAIHGAQGLPATIILNAKNNSHSGADLDNWALTLNDLNAPYGVSLDPLPYYDNLSAELGGGAVGLVPFHLHGLDCVPEQWGSTCGLSYAPNDDRDTLVLRFYGPVIDGTDDDLPPVIVKLAEAVEEPDAIDITDDCDIYVAPTGHRREVWISPKSGAPFYGSFPSSGYNFSVESRVSSNVRDLRCDLTDGPEWIAEKQPPVAAFEYAIAVWCARP